MVLHNEVTSVVEKKFEKFALHEPLELLSRAAPTVPTLAGAERLNFYEIPAGTLREWATGRIEKPTFIWGAH